MPVLFLFATTKTGKSGLSHTYRRLALYTAAEAFGFEVVDLANKIPLQFFVPLCEICPKTII